MFRLSSIIAVTSERYGGLVFTVDNSVFLMTSGDIDIKTGKRIQRLTQHSADMLTNHSHFYCTFRQTTTFDQLKGTLGNFLDSSPMRSRSLTIWSPQ